MDKYIYKGGGYFAGLPARDMTKDEWESYPEKLTKPALKQGLYELSKSKPIKEVKDA